MIESSNLKNKKRLVAFWMLFTQKETRAQSVQWFKFYNQGEQQQYRYRRQRE